MPGLGRTGLGMAGYGEISRDIARQVVSEWWRYPRITAARFDKARFVRTGLSEFWLYQIWQVGAGYSITLCPLHFCVLNMVVSVATRWGRVRLDRSRRVNARCFSNGGGVRELLGGSRRGLTE